MTTINSKFRYILFFIIVLASTQILASKAVAQGVALVTDISGKVTGSIPISILSEIAVDTRLQVESNSQFVVIYLKSGDEYTFTGPSLIQFQAIEPKVIQGLAPQKKASPLGKSRNVTLKPAGITQAAYVMRGGRSTARIKLLTLSGTKSLDLSPEFRWQAIEPGLKYRFELTDDTGRSLFELEVADSALRLPASILLSEGGSYTWEVSAQSRDKRRYVNIGDFSLADHKLRDEANALRPASEAPVSERVAYAAWLEQMDLRDEARKYWEILAAERPDDPRLKALSK